MNNNVLINISKFLMVSFILCGCLGSTYKTSESHDFFYNDINSSYNSEDATKISKLHLLNTEEEKIIKKEYVSINNNKQLSSVLKEIGKIDGNVYILKDKDISIFPSSFKLHNIKELNDYLLSTSGKEIVIKKTNTVSVVTITNKEFKEKNKLSKIQFNFSGYVSSDALLDRVSKSSGFNIVNNEDVTLDTKKHHISVSSILNAIDIVKKINNVYTDIDYGNKIISINKYKNNVYTIRVPRIEISASSESKGEEETSTSELKSTSDITVYDEIETIIKNLVKKDKDSSFDIDKTTGIISAYTTNEINEDVKKIITTYEDGFKSEAIIEFTVVELALNKNSQYGIGGTLNLSSGGASSTALDLGSITSSVATRSGKVISNSVNLDGDLGLNLSSKTGRVVNFYNSVIYLKNNIPTTRNHSTKTSIISNMKTTEEEVDGKTTTSTEAEIEEIEDGNSIILTAKIVDDKAYLTVVPNISKTNKLEEKNLGDQLITLPTVTKQSFNVSIELLEGERIFIGSTITHDDAKTYDGILPYEDFVLGGNTDKDYVRKEILYIVKLKKIRHL